MYNVNNIKIIYDEKLTESRKQLYYNIIIEVITDIEKLANERIDDSKVKSIELVTTKDESWGYYSAYFFHFVKRIKIYVNEDEIAFRELLSHELMHGIFEQRMILNNNCYLYQKQSAGVVYINEFLAYYNTYKYIQEYCNIKNINYKKNYLDKYDRDNKEDIENMYKKYSRKYSELEKGKEVDDLINMVARNIALINLESLEYIKRKYKYDEYLKSLPKCIDYSNIRNDIKSYDVSVEKYIKNIMWVK